MASSYYLYGYQTHFGYTNNIMILVTLAVYALAVLLLILSIVTSRITSKRFKKASFYLANDIAYALVVFSTPNIVTALCLEIQEETITGTGLPWSRILLIGSCVILVIAHFLNLATA